MDTPALCATSVVEVTHQPTEQTRGTEGQDEKLQIGAGLTLGLQR